MIKKGKTLGVGKPETTPISASEHKRLDKRIKQKHEKLRQKYPEIHGKVVDWISHNVEQDSLYVNIRFKDKTDFSLQFSARIEPGYVDLSDISTGDFKLIREYYKRQDI